MRILTVLSCAALVGCAASPEPPSGAVLFAQNCAGCHGDDAKGGGFYAGELTKKPPDLTLLSKGNGGLFPMARVLSSIDGFHRARLPGNEMPEWGLIFGDTIAQVDLGDGVMTPVSLELLALAEYLEGLQQ